MLKTFLSNEAKRNIRLMKRRGKNLGLLSEVLNIIAQERPLPSKYKDHQLYGDYAGHRECHIENDWLLIYRTSSESGELYVSATGTHSDLFGK